MNIQQFFRILWARKLIILVLMGSALIGALAVIKLIPPRYDASSRMMLDIVRPDPVTGEAMNSSFARAYVRTQIELIKDYRIAGRVVDAFNWTGSPALAAQYRDSGSDMQFHRWLAQRIIARTDAALIESSNILEITYAGNDPESAARIADQLRQAYADQTMQFRRQTASRNAAWFERQTDELRRRLAAAEERKATFERASGIVLGDDDSDSESQRLASMAASAPPPPMVTSAPAPVPAVAAPSPSATQLAALDAQIAAESSQLGPNHPGMVALRQQRAVLAAAAAREQAAANAAVAAASRAGAVTVSGPSLESQFRSQQARVLAQRGQVAEARQLMVDVRVAREELQRTALRAAQLAQEARSTETGLTFLGNAVAPSEPTFPKPLPVLIGALGLGAALGMMLAFLTELLNRRVRSPADLTFDGVPVLGMMARDPLQLGRPLLALPFRKGATT